MVILRKIYKLMEGGDSGENLSSSNWLTKIKMSYYIHVSL